MAKLYFRYGAMCSAKTMNLLAVAHNYITQGKKVLLFKPKIDTRFGDSKITSRSGLSMDSMQIDSVSELNLFMDTLAPDKKSVDCILVDECQFLSKEIVDEFRLITITKEIPVICFGLRTDFKTNMFPGSKRLLELADSIEEIKTTCVHCNKKALFNMRVLNGVPVVEGNQIELGSEDKYESVCASCWHKKLNSF